MPASCRIHLRTALPDLYGSSVSQRWVPEGLRPNLIDPFSLRWHDRPLHISEHEPPCGRVVDVDVRVGADGGGRIPKRSVTVPQDGPFLVPACAAAHPFDWPILHSAVLLSPVGLAQATRRLRKRRSGRLTQMSSTMGPPTDLRPSARYSATSAAQPRRSRCRRIRWGRRLRRGGVSDRFAFVLAHDGRDVICPLATVALESAPPSPEALTAGHAALELLEPLA